MGDFTNKMSLAMWDNIEDPYNYQQFANNWQIVDLHDHTPGRGVLVPGAGIANNAITANHLSSALAQDIGLTNNATTGRGAVSIATSQNTTSTTFTTLTTPDQVTGITLNTNGLIHVGYQAMWSSTVGAAGTAQIFLNSTALEVATNTSTAPAVQGVSTPSTANIVRPLVTGSGGLFSDSYTSNYTGDLTTGQIIGLYNAGYGFTTIFAAAGTYTVSVQFKVSSGTLTASNRKLWVWTINF